MEDTNIIIHEEPETGFCPVCDGEGVPMGTLGRTVHFRCRQCGCVFHHQAA